MDPTETPGEQSDDPFQDVPEIKSVTASQGFIPDAWFFWRRRKKPATA
ncbi:MAG: hypothetical protein OXC06_10620 [Acidimicrobiaceae bacterium]|nr:hypothetical protein [Acidimicrobiaceae bacterium]